MVDLSMHRVLISTHTIPDRVILEFRGITLVAHGTLCYALIIG
ncbi:hypothetical protein LCGC14_0735530 [marine sediment metagenome]|jgi:hypothetical protein|uniref:Uncharacterized protein n=1 Tax=marine sediment metagenome TaxID=412755 RepID=A0A0F9TFH5_9ZZZZ